MKPKVLITAPCYEDRCTEGLRILEAYGCELIINRRGRPLTFEEQKEIVGDIDAVIAGSDLWDARIFPYAKKLKYISRFGVGIDTLNLDDIRQFGIRANYSPGINSNAVSEQAIGLLLSLLRNIPSLDRSTKQGGWVRYVTHEIKGQTVGLVGFGAVARLVAEKLIPFGAKLLAYDLAPNRSEAERLGVTLCSFEEVIANSSILSIHVPCTPETRGMFNRDLFAKMKDGVYIVNTARGPIVKESDMYDALVSGKVAGYGTDVFETEPVDPNNPLFTLDQYICTPHTAAETYENYREMGIHTAESIVTMLKGETPKNVLV